MLAREVRWVPHNSAKAIASDGGEIGSQRQTAAMPHNSAKAIASDGGDDGSRRLNGDCAGYGGRELVDIHATLKYSNAKNTTPHVPMSIKSRGREAQVERRRERDSLVQLPPRLVR